MTRRWPVPLLIALLLLPAGPARAADEVCDVYCDGRDATLATTDRQPERATLAGRVLTAHVDDTSGMAWGTLQEAQPGDEVWLDRSFDGGRGWDGRLGAAAATTPMYNVDDPARLGVGVLRACARTGEEIACTGWTRSTRNASDRRTAAATALMTYYDRPTGLFATTGWWNSANALTALIDTMRITGRPTYGYAVGRTYDLQLDAKLGQFRNEYVDDTGWWGLAWIAAYDLTGERRYLDTAIAAAAHMHAYWDLRCGGGVYWKTDRKYKNAITNSLYLQLNAALARRVPFDLRYRIRAAVTWQWFRNTGMLNGADLVNDGISMSTCRTNLGPVWSYNQGTLINALVELHRLTRDPGLLGTARRIGDAATASPALHPGGVLREPCEPANCRADGPSFKGAFVRGLGVLNHVSDGRYTPYLARQADQVYAANRNSFDAYGLHWAGPFARMDAATQQSVLDLFNAAP